MIPSQQFVLANFYDHVLTLRFVSKARFAQNFGERGG
jgi:hypothetical protein